MNITGALFLFVFGAMGFAANLFVRAIFVYEDWQNDDQINWRLQLFVTFGVPITKIYAIDRAMAILGCFS